MGNRGASLRLLEEISALVINSETRQDGSMQDGSNEAYNSIDNGPLWRYCLVSCRFRYVGSHVDAERRKVNCSVHVAPIRQLRRIKVVGRIASVGLHRDVIRPTTLIRRSCRIGAT